MRLKDTGAMTFIETTYFYRNSAIDGGAIKSSDSNIMFTGTAYFDGNVANYDGGAIALINSKLIFKQNLNIFFISNLANETGCALYISDSQCFLRSSSCTIRMFHHHRWSFYFDKQHFITF